MKIARSSCSSVQRRLLLLALILCAGTILLQLCLPAHWQMHCTFRSSTGLPCPGCGASRCGELLMDGQWVEAACMQPLLFATMIVLVPVIAYAVPALLFDWPLPGIRLVSRREWFLCAGALGLLILLNWIYLVIQNV